MSNGETPERNKAIVRALADARNSHDLEKIGLYFADDAMNHGAKVGRVGFVAVLGDIFATFPDWHDRVLRLFAEDDWVVEYVRATGTHLGTARIPHNGDLRHVEPTGKSFDYDQVHFYRLKEGLIIEHEAVRDDLVLHRQLGVVATPAT